MRFALLISYDGTDFSGFQIQPDCRTVQGELERAAEEALGVRAKICGSGRTDAGVHARGQVCHFDAETNIPAKKIKDCFNRFLPPDLRVLKSIRAPEGFDCTRSAKRKTYCYTFYCSETEQPLLRRFCARVSGKPDLSAMREAARLLEGEHDFKAFCAAGSSVKTSVRTVYSVRVDSETVGTAEVFRISVCGSGFLYNMVRIIAGELIAVGCGKREGITAAFTSGRRGCLAKTMPACGLVMENIEYKVPLFGTEEI